MNIQLNGTRHHTSTSLTMRRRLKALAGEYYGTLFDNMVYLKRSSVSYRIHTTDYIAKSYMENS
ncbi:unnamed protein product [Schistosoma margrebowiei]|uniref:Uncharacterized protein n=1 Tax=Schistosoma margrebowiei TaxID=48269 RepID=A0A3P7ZNU9_9TREM|nr:unnamed protein product [Schistosoma margrebowiei]